MKDVVIGIEVGIGSVMGAVEIGSVMGAVVIGSETGELSGGVCVP